ncbi:MAG: glycosyltransferase WbuB [Negativicutes bacterium]|nr:glycosyltransferase WbuB [Negativicutes bacterium]
MKILVFNAYYEPEMIASRYLTTNLYEGMANNGWHVDLYVPYPTRGINEDIKKEYSNKKLEYKCGGNLTIHRLWLPAETKNIWQRTLRYLLMNCAFIAKALFLQADLIFVQSTPPTLGATAAIIKKIKGMPFIYALHDVFPDSLISAGLTVRDSLIWKMGRIVENFTYRNANKVIAISYDIKGNILKKGVKPDKVAVIPNWVESDKVIPVARKDNILFEQLNLDSQAFYVVYAGNMGHAQNIEVILKVASLLNDNTSIQFLIFGSGNQEKEYKEEAERMQLKNLRFFPIQPYEMVKYVYSAGSVGLVTCKKGTGCGAMPSKTWSIMACGRPVLANFDADTELEHLIQTENIGKFTAVDDCEAMKNAIIEYWLNEDSCKLAGENARRYIEKSLTREVCVKRYIDTIAGISERA